MFKSLSAALLAGIVSVACAQAHASNLITNGGFETGTFSGWTATNASQGSLYGVESSFVASGTYAARFGGTSAGNFDSISQTFSTAAGAAESISFDFATDGAAPEFQALFDGHVIFDYTGQCGFPVNTFMLITASATGTGSDTLTFRGYNIPAYDFLDNVSVTQAPVAVTPEPSSLALLGTGMLAAAGMLRRKLLA